MKNYYIPISIIIAGLIIAGAVIYAVGLRQVALPQKNGQKEETKTGITVSEKNHIRGNPRSRSL